MIKRVKWIPFGFDAMAIFFVILTKGEISETLLRHETIHLKQQREMFVVFFIVLYVVEFLIKIFTQRSFYYAYKSISFEREAYRNAYRIGYENKRLSYAWLRYLWED